MSELDPAASTDPAALPTYLDVIVADDDGALAILGAGDTPQEALQALREHLTADSGAVPTHVLYHAARPVQHPDLRWLLAQDPHALAFYQLGRADERREGSDELRELGDERTRRVALERTLRDVVVAVEHALAALDAAAIPNVRGKAALAALGSALDTIREVLPPDTAGEPATVVPL